MLNLKIGGSAHMQNTLAMIIAAFRGGGSWYDSMFFGFGVVMFFPATFLGEIGERIGWVIRRRHIIWLEVIVVSLMVVSMILLKRAYPELPWFEPIGGLFFAALFRGIVWFFTRSSDDDL